MKVTLERIAYFVYTGGYDCATFLRKVCVAMANFAHVSKRRSKIKVTRKITKNIKSSEYIKLWYQERCLIEQ